MSKYTKNKIAITLLSALACSANTSAKNFGIKNPENLPVKTSDFSTNKNLKLDAKSPQTLDMGAHVKQKTGNIKSKKLNKLDIIAPVLLFTSGALGTLILNEIFNKNFNIRSLFKSEREKCSSNLDFIYKKLNGDKDAIKAFEYLKNNIKIFYSPNVVSSFCINNNKNKILYQKYCIIENFDSKTGMLTGDGAKEIGDQEFEELKNEYNIVGEKCYLKKLEEVFSEKCYLNNFKFECSICSTDNAMKSFKFIFFLDNNKTYLVTVHKVTSGIFISDSSFIHGNTKTTTNYNY